MVIITAKRQSGVLAEQDAGVILGLKRGCKADKLAVFGPVPGDAKQSRGNAPAAIWFRDHQIMQHGGLVYRLVAHRQITKQVMGFAVFNYQKTLFRRQGEQQTVFVWRPCGFEDAGEAFGLKNDLALVAVFMDAHLPDIFGFIGVVKSEAGWNVAADSVPDKYTKRG